MKCLVVTLIISTLCIATPVPPGTTTRYSLGGQTHLTYLPQFSDSTKLVSVTRVTKKPKNESFYTDMVFNILSQTKFRGESARKIKRKDEQLLTNFVRNNLEDLNTPNKTMKVGTVNKIKVISNKKSSVAANKVVINVARPVNITLPTKPPFRIKLTPSYISTTKYRKPTTKKPKVKPTIRRVVTKWSEQPTLNEIKQAWYEEGVPYPTPNPEINSHSPPYSLNEVSSLSPSSEPTSAPIENISSPDLSNAISTFNLDMSPDSGNTSRCPNVHISSSVLTPQQRQECSDLNLVINSHFHQNTATDRSPVVPETYDAPPPAEDEVEPPPEPLADTGAAQADPGVQADAPAAPGGGTGGTGGSGGSGGSGGDGDGGGLKLPDLKGLFDFIRWICEKLGNLLGFLKNPYLYIVPIVLFFILGFLAVITLFPWWIPALFLFISAKASVKKKPQITYYNHVHKPVTLHHPDGWFWNHETKTWQNVLDTHRRKDEIENYTRIPQAIENFSRKYQGSSTQSWKWRRRNR